MLLPNKEAFLQDINYIKNDELKDKIMNLYDYVKGINRDNKDLYKLLKEILNSLFNEYGLSKEINIPYTFFETSIGKLLICVLYGSNERRYTVKEFIELTKNPSHPEGYTRQYIIHEIKSGNLHAEREGYKYYISAMEADRYLKLKSQKKQEKL